MNEGGTPEGVHRTSVQKGQLRLLRLMAGASGPVHLPREAGIHFNMEVPGF